MAINSDTPLTGLDEDIRNVSEKLHSIVSSLICTSVNAQARHPIHAMVMASMAASAAIHQLAQSVSRTNEPNEQLTSTAVLFAALLAYRTSPMEAVKGIYENEFSPLTVADALKDFEKLTGRQPDEDLSEPLCRISREASANPALVAKINDERRKVRQGQVGSLH